MSEADTKRVVDALYDEGRSRIVNYVFNDELTAPILRNMHGDSSGVRGAAWLWPREPA